MIKLNKHVEILNTFFKAPLLGVLLISFIVSLLNIPVLVTLWRHSFDDGTYSHAYLIPIISVYLFYILHKAEKLIFRDKFSLPATIFFIFSCLALFITSNAQVSLGYWCSLLVVLVSGINMLYRFNGYIIFPSIYLIFIMPVWGVLTIPLQNLSVKAVTFLMSFSSIPTFVEKQYITIPAGVFEIAGGCSGLRYIIVSLAISSLFIFLYINNVKKALGFLSVAILGALITNWIRITLLILIGDYTNMESSLMEDHNTFGWYLFIPFMIMLFWWGNKIANFDLNASQPSADTLPREAQIKNVPNTLSMSVFVLILCLSSTSFNTLFAPTLSDSNLTSDSAFEVKPDIHFYSFVTRNTRSKNNSVQLTYAFNGEELDGKPTYYENNLVPAGWHLLSDEISPQWRIMVVSNRQTKALVLTRYEIDEKLLVQNKELKLARLLKGAKSINQTKLHWSFTPCNSNCSEEIKNL